MRHKNFNSLDATKLLMACFVVAMHTNPLIDCTNSIVVACYDSIVKCAVPFFFITTGFLLAYKEERCKRGFDVVAKEYMIHTIKLYLALNVVYLPMVIVYFMKSDHSIMSAFTKYIRGFFILGEQYNAYPLWYLLSTIYALAFYLLLIKRKITPNLIIATIMGTIGLLLTFFHDYDVVVLPRIISLAVDHSILNGRIFTGFFYIPVGVLFYKKLLPIWATISFVIVGYIGNVLISDSILDLVFIAITSLGLFCIIVRIKLTNSAKYISMRKMSVLVYYIHMYVWTIFYLIVYGEKRYGMESFLATLFISVGISAIYVLCIRRRKERC